MELQMPCSAGPEIQTKDKYMANINVRQAQLHKLVCLSSAERII